MDKNQKLIQLCVALCSLALFLAFVDFGAFTDIYHDFMGTRVAEQLDVTVPEYLTQRTSTSLEWGAARISWLLRVGVLVLCIGTLLRLRRGLEEGQGN
jgi:hypothetical protein